MSHAIYLPDNVYQTIKVYAAKHGQKPEEFIQAWALALREQAEPAPETFHYDPAEDPLAEFLGTGELTSPDAIRKHDEAIAEEALNAHAE
ncbi:MAG: hypothetical protein OJF49_002003 [Ktedonobacterales bacterium]|nr:MAG: hypothetical protein OJF49_002003 [Ktedonobacterales bacterium]